MTKPFIRFAAPDIGEAEIEAVTRTMRSGWLTTGPVTAGFETDFRAFVGDEDAQTIAVNSATAGLHLALEALGIAAGDEVLVPTWTFTATAEVVRYLGARPVLVDVDPVTLNLDLDDASRKVTTRTRAIMPVHFAGLAVDRIALTRFATQHGLSVVEDAAHALPSTSSGQLVGAGLSDAVVFSFYATKTMTTGEGGMVVVRDGALADRIRTMRLHGINRDVFDRYTSRTASWHYEVVAPGFKYNLTDPAAAMGRVQLSRVREMQQRREAIARRYDEGLMGLPLRLPAHAAPGDMHSWHLYVIRVDDSALQSRDDFITAMNAAGVGCSVHFIPLHHHPYWRNFCEVGPSDFPGAESAFPRVVSLPISSALCDEDVERVIAAARATLS